MLVAVRHRLAGRRLLAARSQMLAQRLPPRKVAQAGRDHVATIAEFKPHGSSGSVGLFLSLGQFKQRANVDTLGSLQCFRKKYQFTPPQTDSQVLPHPTPLRT